MKQIWSTKPCVCVSLYSRLYFNICVKQQSVSWHSIWDIRDLSCRSWTTAVCLLIKWCKHSCFLLGFETPAQLKDFQITFKSFNGKLVVTGHHTTPSCCSEHCVDIRNTALEWFQSYLIDRWINVTLGDFQSPSVHLSYGVPQCSILGIILFLFILSPPWFHLFLKTQYILPFRSRCLHIYMSLTGNMILILLLNFLKDIKDWMTINVSKWN